MPKASSGSSVGDPGSDKCSARPLVHIFENRTKEVRHGNGRIASLLERGNSVQERPAMKSREGVPQTHRTPVPKLTEWDVVTKPARPKRDWQVDASVMAIVYAAALAARRQTRRW
jgi:hypothetical protein